MEILKTRLKSAFRTHSFKTNLLLSFSALLLIFLLITGILAVFIFQSDIKDIEKKFGQSFLENSQKLSETIQASHEKGFNTLINKDIAYILYNSDVDMISGRDQLLKITKELVELKTSLPDMVSNIFIYSGNNTIFTLSGVDEFELFFEKFSVYDKYDTQFWRKYRESIRNFGILDVTSETINKKKMNVIPVAISYGTIDTRNVMVICVSVDDIKKSFLEHKIFEQETIICLDENNNEIFYLGDEGKHELLLSESMEGSPSYTNNELKIGKTRYKTQAYVDEYGYKYFYYVPNVAILKLVLQQNAKVIIIFIVAFAVGLWLTFLFSIKLYNPIKKILEVVKGAPDYYIGLDVNNKEVDVINSFLSDISSANKSITTKFDLIKTKYIDRLFMEILEGRNIEDNIKAYIKTEISFDKEFYTCALLEINLSENYLDNASSVEEILIFDKLAKMISMLMKDFVNVYYLEYKKYNYAFIFNTEKNNKNKIMEAIDSIKYVFEYDKKFSDIKIGIGNTYGDLNRLYNSYFDAETALLYKKHNKGFNIADAQKMNIRKSHILSQDDTNSLLNFLKIGDPTSAKSKIEEIFAHNMDNVVSTMGLRQLVYELYCIGYRYLFKKGIDLEDIISKEENHKLLFILEDIKSDNDKNTGLIIDFYVKICEKANNLPDNRSQWIVEEIISFIKENYSEDLYLETIGDAMGFSSKYISKIFKDQMNESIIDYLSHYRIEKAEKLLKGKMGIEEISKAVGFDNRITFFRKFKKYKGVSPAYYKKICERE